MRRRICALAICCLLLAMPVLSLRAATASAATATPPPPFTVDVPLIFSNYGPTWKWQSPISFRPNLVLGKIVMAFDQAQVPHLIWDKSYWAGGSASIYHSFLSAGSWIAASPLSQTSGEATLLRPPYLGPDGRLHLLWRVSSPGGPYRLMYAAWAAGEWSPAIQFISENQDAFPQGLVRTNLSGEAELLGWYSGAQDLSISHWILHDGYLEWDNLPNLTQVEQLWLDGNGGVRVYSDDWSVAQGRYDYWKGGSFLDSAYLGAELGARTGILDGADNLHLFRRASTPDGKTTGLYHQCLSGGLTWGNEEVVSGTATLDYTLDNPYLVALSPEGNIAVAYQDSRTGALGAITWRGCDLASRGVLPASSAYTGLDALAFAENPAKLCLLRHTPSNSNNLGLFCAALQY